ncbi:MAG: hypothetical protein AABY64_09330 [Bdellovibrionota bacterium]
MGLCSKFSQIIFCLAISFLPRLSYCGTESGGGGTSVDYNGSRILLDFLRIEKGTYKSFNDNDSLQLVINNKAQTFHKSSISDKFFIKKNESSISISSKELSLILNSPKKITEINQPSDLFFSDPMQLVLHVLSTWTDNNPLGFAVDSQIFNLFAPVTWQISSQNLKGSTAALQDFQRKGISNPRLVAYYKRDFHAEDHSKSEYKILINAPEWNQLSVLSQAGTILHEGIRHHQFLNMENGQVEVLLDESALQTATAIILLCKPRPMLSQYLNYLFLGRQNTAPAIALFGTYENLIEKYCIPSFHNGVLNLDEDWNNQ